MKVRTRKFETQQREDDCADKKYQTRHEEQCVLQKLCLVLKLAYFAPRKFSLFRSPGSFLLTKRHLFLEVTLTDDQSLLLKFCNRMEDYYIISLNRTK
jgi:hypothetical protein